MQWFLNKGTKIKESEPASFRYYYDMSEDDVDEQDGKLDLVTMTVYTCNEDNPPKYPDSSKFTRSTYAHHPIEALNMLMVEQASVHNWSS